MKRRRIVIALAAAAVIVPGAALALQVGTVAPTSTVRAAVLKAFGDPPAADSCLVVLVAASSRDYATVRYRPRRSCVKWMANGLVIFHRGNRDHWRLAFDGSAWTCPVARIPRSVQRDFGMCA